MAIPKHIIAVAAVAGTLLTAVAAAPANAATAPATRDIDGISVSDIAALSDTATKDDVLEYVATDPTTTTTDSATGELVAVSPVSTISTRISERNNCQSGDAYWASAGTLYTNNCFCGSAGTFTFPSKGTKSCTFYTGKYTARDSWLSGGNTLWGPRQNPGSTTP
ncbi:hypothetical protein [Curtobacterium sp. 458]|uniref:hypothetical protein n=1 Tax=Curtobacterium sp. 458 TaxID=3050069 RepID=UPI0025B5DF3B|nr:hypothetical protein [Curtobacterium sp. 458]WJY00877.1 hypothetical protein QPJ90_04050 [Curtobacterium sp. 458]